MSTPKENKPRILLLSGYDAASHRYWRSCLVNGLEKYKWTEIALPDRYFSWRIRGNSLTFAFQHRKILQQEFDCLIVTSMVDYANLRGFIPELSNIPCVLYFHENQFEYPMSGNSDNETNNIINAQLTSIYSLLCADKVLFNSLYNQQTFFRGAERLLKKLPDGIPKDLLRGIKSKTDVLPVPISSTIRQKLVSRSSEENLKPDVNSKIEIVWNHRWEYDKQPEVFFDAMKMLKEHGYEFKIHVVGQSFRNIPECFVLAEQILGEEIASWGFLPIEEYHRVLCKADLVVSTALHDFQGLSMLEAISCGCLPVAPNRVAYPEYIDKENLYRVSDSTEEAKSLFDKMVSVFEKSENNKHFKESQRSAKNLIKDYFEDGLLIKYQRMIDSTIERHFNKN